jgi:integrase
LAGEVARDCIKLIAFTGCRPIEAKRALWPEFDTEEGFWCKPSAHTKQKRQHRVPLSASARMLIEQLRAKRDPNKAVVFPGRSKDGTVDALQHCWRHVRQHAGLGEDCRLYDLRHSFASVGAGSGLSLPIIGKLLGHTTSKTTERYARHLADDPLKTAVDKIADRITGKRFRVVEARRP